ncbi:hypothetical protein BV902_21120 [Sphingobacterium sp. B29]|uniref:NAD-dependent epimerase/dehydratase family protein n=1 Tax=Sphingobacterium sp. B29 TaxID=1933220 RepID=UPI000957EC84|nr:NAD-dependent epimerase/dehydratase family protein [Sphingobacterium sp. B29]APU98530.1 hypothetical protein BV902_21120 [Sphingobacterium sp. B29]
MKNQQVLLTGVTGFLGAHTAIQLLNKGYEVIGTLRNGDRISSIKEVIVQHTDLTPYYKSKTIAEKAAWNFIQKDASSLELVTVCPGAILGPVIERDHGTSAEIVVALMNGSYTALPKIGFDLVDVRSVADLLILAMESPEATGNRYIAATGYLTLKAVALILKDHFPGRKIPTAEFPNFIRRMLAQFRPELKPVLLEMVRRKTDISKAQRELGWKPIPVKEAVISCANSLLELQIVK